MMLMSLAWPLVGDLRKAAKQKCLVQAIRSQGGKVRYAHEYIRAAPQPSPLWTSIFGLDSCADVTDVHFPRGTATDDQLRLVSGLPKLQDLYVGDSPITDAGLEHIASLKELANLSLCGTEISDAGLKSLSGLKHLRYLNLDRTKVTDAGLEALEGLEELHFLCVCRTRVTEAGLARLACLPKLGVLNVSAGSDGGLVARRLKHELPSARSYGIDDSGKTVVSPYDD